MPALSPRRTTARAALAAAHCEARRRPDDAEAQRRAEDRARNYRFVSAQEYIERLVASAPALTPAMRDALAVALRGGAR